MKYFIYKDKEQKGPFSLEELESQGISSETLIWHDGMPQWLPAWQVDEVRNLLSSNKMPPPPPNEVSGEKHLSETGYPNMQPNKKKRGCQTPLIIGLAIIVAILLALFLTCPDRASHEDMVKDSMKETVNKTYSKSNGEDPFKAFGQVLATGIINTAVGQMLTVDNYGIFSIGKIHFNGKTKVVSIGILGHVFTFDANDLERKLNKIEDSADLPANNSDSESDAATDKEQQTDSSEDDASNYGL